MPSFVLYTLGCKVNQYESQYVREGLERLGFQEAGPGQKVDLCIVNTCTVTAESDLKSRKIIRQLARRHPEAGIFVMGCYATRAPQELAALPHVVQILPDKAELPQWLAQLGLENPPVGISSFGSRHRAFVKIQDGCRQGCSYCTIPLVRPVLRSRPVEQVVEEVQRLTARGYGEIVLTGIHLGHYGLDLPTPRVSLAQVVDRLLGVAGSFRLRLSSLEAVELDGELVRLMAENPDRLCPHLHLPLQSGSDRVLQQMGRPYRLADFLRRCDLIRAWLERPALTTDILVGFPGETEEDFQATYRAVEKIGFSKLHLFPYSARPGTRAALLPDRVPPRVIRRRCAELAELGAQLRRQYMETLVGRTAQILVEEVSPPLSDGNGPQLGYCPTSKDGLTPSQGRESPSLSVPQKIPSNSGVEPHLNRGSFSSKAFQGPDHPSFELDRDEPAHLREVAAQWGLDHPSFDLDRDCRDLFQGTSPGENPLAALSPMASTSGCHLLQGTSERYVPVKLVGPKAWLGRLVTVWLEAVVEENSAKLALWASERG